MAKKIYESDNIQAIADKMRELTGTSTKYSTYDFADGVEEVYNVGYEKGYADGQTQGGSPSPMMEEIETMLSVAPFMRKMSNFQDEEKGYMFSIGSIFGRVGNNWDSLLIIPPWVTELEENVTDIHGSSVYAAIFTSKTPPVCGWQGGWSSDGGNWVPQYIFVPDESLEAYKTTTNLAEFADNMRPLSEYNGEGYMQDYEYYV